MLTDIFPQLNRSKIVRVLRAYFRSVAHPIAVAALMALSAIFYWEIPVYYCYFILGGIALFVAEDTRAIVPVVCCAVMSVFAKNGPVVSEPATDFRPDLVLHLTFIVSAFAVLLLGRLITELIFRSKKGVPRLTIGFVVLGLALILGGIFSPYYTYHTALFGLALILALCLLYFFFYYTVDWKNADAGYIFTVLVAFGAGVAVEIVARLAGGGVPSGETADGLGCVMAMCVPAPFYFAYTKRNGWIFTLIGSAFYGAAVCTVSGPSVLFGGIIYLVCLIVVAVKRKGKEQLAHLIVGGAVLAVLVVLAGVFHAQTASLFVSLSAGTLARYSVYWNAYLVHPSFGVGFNEDLGGFAFAYNTYLQLLACGGTVALLAYLYHRIETLVVLLRCPTKEKVFLSLGVAALILTSMLGSGFFGFSAAILYSVFLVFLEGTDKRVGAKLRLRLKQYRTKVLRTTKRL